MAPGQKVAKPNPVAVEDFLTTIFRFNEEGRPVISVRLAEALGVSPATAFGMLKRMGRDGLVKISKRREIDLTPPGHRIAANVIRRHRLAERFLTDVLGLERHKAYNEAHRLEHGISAEVADKLMALLNSPTACPHGYPIPGADGYRAMQHLRTHLKALKDIPQGTEVEVKRVPEGDPELLRYLDEHNVSPSGIMKVKEVADYKGTMTLEIDGHDIVISTDTAAKIIVKTT